MTERTTTRTELVLSTLLLVIPLLFLFATARPDVEGSDSAELVAASFSLGIAHATGYPLYTWVGRIAIVLSPLDPAHTMNLLSALLGAAALLLFALAAREITGNLLSAAAPIAGLAFARPFWFISTVAEVYALHLFFLAATLLFLFRWRRTGAPSDLLFAVYAVALGFAHHGSTALFLPGYVLFVLLHLRSVRRAARFAPGLLLVPIALGVYLHHPIRHRADPPIDAFREIETRTRMGILDADRTGKTFEDRFLYKVLGEGPARKLDPTWETARGRAGTFPATVRASLGTLVACAGIAGLLAGIAGGPRAPAILLAWGFVANTLFFSNFRTEDLEDFLVPSLLLLALAASLAMEALRRTASSLLKRRAAGTILLLVLALGNGVEIVSAARAEGGYRHSAPTLARERDLLLADLPNGAQILIPWGRATVLRYVQIVEGIRPDIEIHAMARRQYEHAVPSLLERGPVFAEDAGEGMRERFDVAPFGPLFRIERRADEAGVSH
ncbi:MAG: DUF2723 domain-containing protein [Candidatus Eisenbacteria bacterium]|nr:DUF2723 domain-containing protein [Candidatus Eisenbacteria bacterium]